MFNNPKMKKNIDILKLKINILNLNRQNKKIFNKNEYFKQNSVYKYFLNSLRKADVNIITSA